MKRTLACLAVLAFAPWARAADQPYRGPVQAATITDLQMTTDGAVTVQWQAAPNTSFDIYTSGDAASETAAWSRVGENIAARARPFTCTVDVAQSMHFFQVMPAGEPRAGNGIWGAIALSFPQGSTLATPPLMSDRRFDAALGAQMAAAFAGSGESRDDGADEISILTPGTTNWTKLHLDDASRWVTAEGEPYTRALAPGQGFVVTRKRSGPARAIFTGPLGNIGASVCFIHEGMNIVGFSEGLELPIEQVFAHPVTGQAAGSYDETEADRIAALNPDGSWHRFMLQPNGHWLDLRTTQPATFAFEPGQAVYFERPVGKGPLAVRY